LRRPLVLVLALALAALAAGAALAGCRGEERQPGAQASISSDALRGKKFTVGSKEFTEQLVLGQIAIAALEAAGAEVEDETGLAGSVTARRALTSGEIDIYWEYTGTAWIVYFDETEPLRSSRAQYQAVAARDRERNRVAWLPYAPFNNTYAIAARAADAPRLGVRTVSDLARLARERPQEATVCVGEEFRSRDDGLPGLERTYGFDLPDGQIFKLDEGLVYQQVADGERCNFGSVFSTDARIDRLKLAVLRDDRSFFPRYNPAVNVRAEVVRANPSLRSLFAAIAARLDDATMRRLNGQVDVDGETPDRVAERWLLDEGLIR